MIDCPRCNGSGKIKKRPQRDTVTIRRLYTLPPDAPLRVRTDVSYLNKKENAVFKYEDDNGVSAICVSEKGKAFSILASTQMILVDGRWEVLAH